MIIKLCLLPMVLCFDTYSAVSFSPADRAFEVVELDQRIYAASAVIVPWENPPQIHVEDQPEVIFRNGYD